MSAFDGTNGPTLKVQFYKSSTWTDATSTDLREIQIHRGRARADQKIDAGTATVVFDNRSGYYDPDYLGAGSPWVVSGASILRDGLQARIVATWSGVGYVLYRGYLEGTTVDAGFNATATMTFVDGIANISKAQAPKLKTMSYANETTQTRVGRLLTIAKWPTGSSWRSIDGSIPMQSTAQGDDVMTMIEQCVAAEAGGFYISRSGIATFITLHDKFSRPTQLLFNDDRSANTVEYSAITTTPGTKQVINQAIVTRGKLKQKVFTYTPSVTAYGLKTVTVEALIPSDKHANNLALYYARKDANPKTTVEKIEFTPWGLDTLWDDFLACELFDQVTVKRQTVDGRNLTMNLVIEGMDHTITPDDWSVLFATSPMNPYRITI